ncbi:ribonuclease E/G [Sinisalibacter lacisalsi]|uniref:Ribonuclease G n=1 Tax=Sinisalibacter lacisalsi TaxID=1526570 RepID=A0ABQ1QI64_9RHOB|nr:ribonuclease E/G [Sinisalibacter lacisalsi]GGD28097.1 ribonuclease G [Sinisalibacter lacisalsi]
MKGSVIALDEIAGRKAAARLVDGQLDDFLVDPAPEDPSARPGAIYRAICDRPMKGQGGMFVRLPEGSGFLRQAKGLKPGQPLLAQVTGWAEPGKAVPLTAKVLFKSRYAIVTPGAPGINLSRRIHDEEARVRLLEIAHEAMGEAGDTGLILRSEAAGGDDAAVAEDVAAMRDLARAVLEDAEGREPELLVDGPDAHLLAWRDWAVPDHLDDAPGSFARHGIDEMIAILRNTYAPLSGGAFAHIEQTRALIAVDVNTGGDTSPAAGLKANIALARALPRLLRCKGLGGQITLDLAPMPKKDRPAFEQTIRAAFRADPIETVLAGWTPLGHYELQRQRARRPLAEMLP